MTLVAPISIDDALTAYRFVFLAQRNLALRTRKEYLTDLRQLAEYLQGIPVMTVSAVERVHLEGFLATLDEQQLAGTTRRRKVAAIRSFFFFLDEAGHRRGNPAAKLVPPEREWNEPRYLTEQEYKRLLEAVRHEPRDAALIELVLQTGLRLSEVSRLRLSDVELPPRVSKEQGGVGSVRVQGKGRRQRTVTLNWKVCKALKAYLTVRPPDAQDDSVFQTKYKQGMGPRSIEDVVSKYLNDAGIRDASVHTLRHTFATHQVKKGTSIKVVQDALGHASLKTTTIYVSLAREEMDRQLQEHAL